MSKGTSSRIKSTGSALPRLSIITKSPNKALAQQHSSESLDAKYQSSELTQRVDANPNLWGENISNFKTLEIQIKEGKESVSIMQSFFEKYVKLQRQMGVELTKLCKSEASKFRSRDGDLMKSTGDCFVEILANISKVAEAHQNHAMNIEAFVLEKLNKEEESYKKKVKEIMAEQKDLYAEMSNTKAEVAKQKAKCLKSLQSVDKKGSTDPVSKAYEACLIYKNMIDSATTADEEYRSVRLPAIITKLQQVEDDRSEFLRKLFFKYVSLGDPFVITYKDWLDRSSQSLSIINTSEDLVRVMKRAKEDAHEDFSFEYDLPISLKDLRGQVEPLKKESLGIGKFPVSSLSEIMLKQKESHPNLHLPLMVIRLRNAIIQLGGYSSEGIFRLSVDQKILDAFIEQLKEGDYNFTFSDPNIPAAALKQWIRELPHPLLDYQIFIDHTESKTELTSSSLASVLSKIPAENKALLHALADITRNVSSAENIGRSKMSVANMATLFTPSIIRDPDESKRRANFLQVFNSEISFVESVFSVFEIDASLLE
jgi:hypothetical protein